MEFWFHVAFSWQGINVCRKSLIILFPFAYFKKNHCPISIKIELLLGSHETLLCLYWLPNKYNKSWTLHFCICNKKNNFFNIKWKYKNRGNIKEENNLLLINSRIQCLSSSYIIFVIKPTLIMIISQSLSDMGELRDSEHFFYKAEMDKALGSAVKTLGPRLVLEALPLGISGEK